MSTLPPPVPNSRRPANQPPAPPGSSISPSARVGSFSQDDLEKASPIPIIISAISIVLSSAIIFFGPDKSLIFGAVGYLLTPFITILATGIDAVSQRKKSSTYPWYVENPRYAKVLRILALVSLVLSYPHINVLADYFSIELAKIWPF